MADELLMPSSPEAIKACGRARSGPAVPGDLHPQRLEAFLTGRYRRMPRTMLRYAIEKPPEERRRRYLRGEA